MKFLDPGMLFSEDAGETICEMREGWPNILRDSFSANSDFSRLIFSTIKSILGCGGNFLMRPLISSSLSFGVYARKSWLILSPSFFWIVDLGDLTYSLADSDLPDTNGCLRELFSAVLVWTQNFPGVKESNCLDPKRVFLIALGVTGRDNLNFFYVVFMFESISPPSNNCGDPFDKLVVFLYSE